jgi:hypothetical protein
MPATVTVTGTWTPLNVDLTRMGKTSANVPHSDMMQLEQLKALGGRYPELVQFVQAFADGLGIGFNPAVTLMDALWTAMRNAETPTVSQRYLP